MFDLVSELVSTFRAPSPKMVERMERIARSIPEDARESVYEAILEELGANAQVGTKDIIAACRKVGAPYSEAHYLPAEDWICDGCGRQFKFHPCPTDDDKIDKGIFDFCPDCGLQPHYTKLAQEYALRGIKTPWYNKLVEKAKKWGRDTEPKQEKTRMGGAWTVGGMFWYRSNAEKERREERRIKVDAKMAEIDRAKRWDEEDDE